MIVPPMWCRRQLPAGTSGLRLAARRGKLRIHWSLGNWSLVIRCSYGNGKARLALQTPRVLVSVERDLRRSQRLLGLRPLGRGAEAEHQGGLVAGYGVRPRRPRRAAGCADGL